MRSRSVVRMSKKRSNAPLKPSHILPKMFEKMFRPVVHVLTVAKAVDVAMAVVVVIAVDVLIMVSTSNTSIPGCFLWI